MDIQFELGAAALNALEQRHDSVAANMATSTPGSKETIVATGNPSVDSPGFSSYMNKPVIEASTNFSQGPIIHTGNPTDVAIRGDKGFFSVDGGKIFTRDGSFHWSADNKLVNAMGSSIDGEAGEITRNPALGLVSIDAGGNVYQGNQKINTIKIVDVAGSGMKPVPGGFELVGDVKASAMEGVSVAPNSLEQHNGSSAKYMTDLVRLTNSTQAVSRMISQVDQLYQNATSLLNN